MDQDSGSGGGASEDTSRAREHVHNAEENRDALAAQSRRTEATATGGDTPIGSQASGAGPASGSRSAAGGSGASGESAGGTGGSGLMNATGGNGGASDDASQARENVRAAEENRDALADENRRVQGSVPPDVNTTGR